MFMSNNRILGLSTFGLRNLAPAVYAVVSAVTGAVGVERRCFLKWCEGLPWDPGIPFVMSRL
jgi:hypothetical protein